MAQADRVSQEEFDQLASDIESATDLTEEARASLLSRLQEGRGQLEVERGHRANAAQFRAAIDGAGAAVAQFRQMLEEARAGISEREPVAASDATVADLESRIALLQSERQALVERRRSLQDRLGQRAVRRADIQARLQVISTRLAGNQHAMALPAATPEARVAWLTAAAENQALDAERMSLEAELLSEPYRSEIAAAERAWIERAIAGIDGRLAALQTAVGRARERATQLQLEETVTLQGELYSDQSELLALAESNRRLAEELARINDELAQAASSAFEMREYLEYLENESTLMQRRLEVARNKSVLAGVMIERLYSLQDTQVWEREIRQRNDLIAASSLAIIDTEEELRRIDDPSAFLEQWLSEAARREEHAREPVESLLRQRGEILQNKLNSHARLQQILIENNSTANSLVQETRAFQQFLSGNLLWVRSYSALAPGTLYAQIISLLPAGQWRALPADLVDGWRRDHWSTAWLVIFLAVLVVARQWRKPYRELMARPTPRSGESLWNILLALGMSLVLVLPCPLLLYLLARSLSLAAHETQVVQAIAPALATSASLLYFILLARLLMSKRGLCRRFLKMNARTLDSLRSELSWAGPAVLAGVFIDQFAYHLDVVSSGGPLSALSVTAIAVVVLAVAVRLLRRDVFQEQPRVRLALKLTAAGGLLIIALQLMGLFFAADRFQNAFIRSIVIVLLVNFVIDILKRWLLILRSRLERKARDKSRTDQAIAPEGSADDAGEAGQVDVLRLSEAHNKLLGLLRAATLSVALVLTWSPVLPALTLLESATLWHTGNPGDPLGGLRAITLFDLGVAVFILVITWFVARYLPSLIQVFMLEWMKASAGARYATGMLMQYVVIAVGLSLCLTRIGWEWSKVQWLVAALGVGIGFGLQEIVANFISGLIVLFERPIRVGDIITVSGAEGTVRRISARATLIETFDRKEILIPNKQLITDQVTNWSLSDEAVRVLIPVGVAYGSDVRLARRLLLEAAAEVSLVMQDPEPTATFDDFGDNALLLTLRCFVTENRLQAWTLLRESINDKFAAAGISIAFPQRDVHLDMGQPLRIQIDQLPRLDVPGAGDNT